MSLAEWVLQGISALVCEQGSVDTNEVAVLPLPKTAPFQGGVNTTAF
jgi:hypothetical protein